jgi:hypothetical protein
LYNKNMRSNEGISASISMSTPEAPQPPQPGTLEAVRQRLWATHVANTYTAIDTTGSVSAREKARAEAMIARIQQQDSMIESLKAGKVHELITGGDAISWEEAEAQAEALTASEAANRLADWMNNYMGDPQEAKDSETKVAREHAEDLLYKLIDEAPRLPM